MSLIYQVISPSGKMYIGKTDCSLAERKSKHFYDAFSKNLNTKFCKAIRKYKEQLKWNIFRDDLSKDEVCWHEIWLINFFDTYKSGYNSTIGGEGKSGVHCAEKTRLKISNSKKYKKLNLSKEERSNRSKRVSGYKNPMFNLKGPDNPNFGLKRSDEVKQKMSKSKKGNDNPLSYAYIMKKYNCTKEEAKAIRLYISPGKKK